MVLGPESLLPSLALPLSLSQPRASMAAADIATRDREYAWCMGLNTPSLASCLCLCLGLGVEVMDQAVAERQQV